MIKYIRYVLLSIIFIFICILSVLNGQLVLFNYLFGKIPLPIIVLMLISFILGLTTGILLISINTKKYKKWLF